MLLIKIAVWWDFKVRSIPNSGRREILLRVGKYD